MSISKIFKPNFVCVFTNKIYETYQTEFTFCRLGQYSGYVLVGVVGKKLECGDLRWRSIDCAFCFVIVKIIQILCRLSLYLDLELIFGVEKVKVTQSLLNGTELILMAYFWM